MKKGMSIHKEGSKQALSPTRSIEHNKTGFLVHHSRQIISQVLAKPMSSRSDLITPQNKAISKKDAIGNHSKSMTQLSIFM